MCVERFKHSRIPRIPAVFNYSTPSYKKQPPPGQTPHFLRLRAVRVWYYSRHMNTNENNPLLLAGSVIIAGLLIAGAVFWNGSRPAAPAGGAPVAKVDIKDVKTDGEPFVGQASAPVTIAFWSDFQCPYCKAFEIGHPQVPTPAAFPDILKNYVDTGKVKVVFKDVAFLGEDSMTGAIYSNAVWKLYPEKYFEWRTVYFQNQDQEHGGFGTAASIDAMNAKIAGLDAVKIAKDVKDNMAQYTARVQATTAEAQKLGVRSTPSVIVGKELIAGAYPFANFQTAIEKVLK
jgi:protein-disulfide isomerase